MSARAIAVGLGLAACAMGLHAQGVEPPVPAPAPPAAVDMDGSQLSGRPVGADGVEYGGVVTAQTITGAGHTFFVRFSEGWSQFNDTQNQIIVIRERPSPRGGTEIQILANDDLVLKTSLPRNHYAVVSAGERAVEFVHQKIQETNIQALLFADPDLAKSGL